MITGEMKIGEVTRLYPETIEVFHQFGLDCMDCQMASVEEIAHGAGVHHIDLEKLLEELNRATRK